jgi:NTE family protein
VLREGGRIKVQVGTPGIPSQRFDTGELFAQFAVDKLDEVAFPHRGVSLRVRVSSALEALGSTTAYEQAWLEGQVAGTHRRNTAVLGGSFGTSRRSDAPIESRFRLGGLGQLSGLEQDERVGQHAALARAMLYRRVSDFELLPVYVGIAAEYGNVFASRSAIRLHDGLAAGSVFVGMDTPLGPLCAAYGRAEGDRGNYYLTLGQPLGGARPGFRLR